MRLVRNPILRSLSKIIIKSQQKNSFKSKKKYFVNLTKNERKNQQATIPFQFYQSVKRDLTELSFQALLFKNENQAYKQSNWWL